MRDSESESESKMVFSRVFLTPGTCQKVSSVVRVPLEIPLKFLAILLTFGLLDQFLTAVSKCLKPNVTNKLEIVINRVINSREVKFC